MDDQQHVPDYRQSIDIIHDGEHPGMHSRRMGSNRNRSATNANFMRVSVMRGFEDPGRGRPESSGIAIALVVR